MSIVDKMPGLSIVSKAARSINSPTFVTSGQWADFLRALYARRDRDLRGQLDGLDATRVKVSDWREGK